MAVCNGRQVTIDFGSPLGVAAEQMSFPGESDTPDNLRYQFQIDGSSGEFKPKILDIVIEGATQQ